MNLLEKLSGRRGHRIAVGLAPVVVATAWALSRRRFAGVARLGDLYKLEPLPAVQSQARPAGSSASRPPLTAGQRLRNRVLTVAYVTGVECGGLYLWLRLSRAGRAGLGAVSLVVEETLESGLLLYIFVNGPQEEYDRDDPAVAAHLQRARNASALAINAEILIWLVWLSIAETTDWPVAALFLLVSMHPKHQLEAATVVDTSFGEQFLSPRVVIGSLSEVVGGVACLQLLRGGRRVRAAAALVGGIGFEHALFIDEVQNQMESRDICLPKAPGGAAGKSSPACGCAGKRSSVWRRSGVRNTVNLWLATHLTCFWDKINHAGLARSLVNENLINQFVSTMEPRPALLSTKAPYTSWDSLTDRTFSDRHLPPWTSAPAPPDIKAVVELFSRSDESARDAEKSTLLFPFFAQWFVDGFLRMDPADPRKNTSSHEIDLSQLYGHDRAVTDLLRSHEGGELKSEMGTDGEYPPKYFDSNGKEKPEFEGLHLIYPDDMKGPDLKAGSTSLSVAQKSGLFALGLPRGNIHYGTALMSTVFLREHNRLARRIADATGWDRATDDDRIFETARSALIVMLLKVVIQDYINHITPFKFRFVCEPGAGAGRPWFRTNWMSIEFDLLYRWHALVPETITLHGQKRRYEDLLWDTTPLTTHGVSALVDEASNQPCAEMGLLNTPQFLLEAEQHAIQAGRVTELASYNDYRQACGYPRLRSFADVSTRPEVQCGLAKLYGSVDDVEFYVGLFAEDVVRGGVLPELMGTMVGVDAFSQALTNPLLGPRMFSEQTFSKVGMAAIEDTNRLQDIVRRNVPPGPPPRVSFERAPNTGGAARSPAA